MQQNIQDSLSLSTQQAQAILALIGLHGAVQVTAVSRHNHVWQLQCDGATLYLKCYTKDWYGDDVPRTEYCVRHERDAYALLARRGLPTVDVVLARPDCDNPMDRPFLLTRQLEGISLNHLLAQADARTFQHILARVGGYLRQMHDITFAYPGYITGDGPTVAPAVDDWQHPVWSAAVCQRDALAMLARKRDQLSPQVVDALQARFSSLADAFAPAYQPLRFVQANMHAHQFFLSSQKLPSQENEWHVTGVLDMEVASAGDAMFDLVAFALEMAAFHAPAMRWWEPFFAGYGGDPDFELFRLHMLTFGEPSFKCFGPERWQGTRQEILARLLAAKKWETLFAT